MILILLLLLTLPVMADDEQPVQLLKKCSYFDGHEDCGYYMYQCVKFCNGERGD